MTPLDRVFITQKFGNNPTYYTQFGFKGHEGLDFRTQFDDSPDGKRPCRTICDGVAVIKNEGAYGKHIIVQDYLGNQYYYCHLDSFLITDRQVVKKGQSIGITGISGNSQGAHLHFCVKPNKPDLNNGFKGFVDPIDYVKKVFDIRVINGSTAPLLELGEKIELYSQGLISVIFDVQDIPINVPVGMFTQEQAYKMAKDYHLDNMFVMFCYKGNTTSTFLASYYHPDFNQCLSTIPTPADAKGMAFEYAHQVQIWYNENRGILPHIEIVDSNFPNDELIASKYLSIAPYLDLFDGTYPIKPMYKLIRHPTEFNEVYALKDGAVRHIVNLETLKQGDREPDRYWQWGGSDIPQATAGEWATYTEAGEILLLPKD